MDPLTVVAYGFLMLLAWLGLAAVAGLVLGPLCGAHDRLAPLPTDDDLDDVRPSFTDAELDAFRASLPNP